MKAAKIAHTPQGNLFRMELVCIVDPHHALVRLSQTVDWARFEEAFGNMSPPENRLFQRRLFIIIRRLYSGGLQVLSGFRKRAFQSTDRDASE